MIIAWTNEVDDRSAPVGEPESDAEMFVIINLPHKHEPSKITDHIQEPGNQIETWEIFFNIKKNINIKRLPIVMMFLFLLLFIIFWLLLQSTQTF